jgi:uncharacterized protein (TIGR03118 family)
MTIKRLTRLNWIGAGLFLATAVGVTAQTATPPNNYLVHNLVSDLTGVADHQDPNLINPWGNGFSSTSPFWIGNNGTGTSTLYDGYGTATALVVTIPQAGNAGHDGPVTGVIFNSFGSNTNAFDVQAEKPASFIFCSKDGVISGWNSGVSGTAASILFDNSKAGAVYTGCALGGTAAAPYIFAANFNAGTVDVYDGSLNLNPAPYTKAFQNSAIPAGYAPFNVQNINGILYVAYAKQNSAKNSDVGGAGFGYVATFSMSGTLITNLISQGTLDAPWGLAIAPATFGPFGGALLVGNFDNGNINAFNAMTGAPLGMLNDASGNPIALPGLWSLNFGTGAKNEDAGTLYITAGIGGGPNNDPVGSHGLYASIQAVPSFTTSGIENAATSIAGPLAPNTWAEIKGFGLAPTTGTWQVTGSVLPTTLNGVGVTVGGTAVPVSFISNTQVNFLVPSTIPQGTTQVQMTNNGLTSANVTATVAVLSPAFFIIGTNATTGNMYVAAEHANGTLAGPTATIATATPVEPGETIAIYGTGFGPELGSSIDLSVTPTIVIDGQVATVAFAGVVGPGLYQFNVVVPQTVTLGQDVLVVGLSGNSETQPNAFLTINNH